MYENHTIAVVVPAYNEEKLIGRVLESMPDFVDKIVVIDDASQDKTAEVICQYQNEIKNRLYFIQQTRGSVVQLPQVINGREIIKWM